MIYSLTGKLLELAPGAAVISCGGVGYLVGIPQGEAGAVGAVGDTVTLYTHMNVSENDVSLFGFATKAGREAFLVLTSVSGVGPKAGLAILSVLSPGQIVRAVSEGDFKASTAANGVGQKLGQRLVLELRDKLARGMAQTEFIPAAAAQSGAAAQAAAALVNLGYSQAEAVRAVAPVDSSLPVAELIRLALREIGAKKNP